MMKQYRNDLVVLAQVENNMFKILDKKIEMFFLDYGHIIFLAWVITLILVVILYIFILSRCES